MSELDASAIALMLTTELAVAIACASMATEMVLGKSVEEASQITEQAVAEALGGIPEYKMLCSNLAPQAIRKAIEDWRSRASPREPNGL